MSTSPKKDDVPVEAPETALEGAELLEAIKKQVEFYFSKENLMKDQYLVSKMNAQLFVPISLIAEFSKVKALSTSTETIAEALRGSSVCTLDPTGAMIKPNIKAERTTIILREIPSSTPPEEVKELFASCGTKMPSNIRSDVGDTWFITMPDEESAMATIIALRSQSFKGKPIKSRLKSENILRSLIPTAEAAPVDPAVAAATAAAATAPGGNPYGYPGAMGMGWGAMPAYGAYGGSMFTGSMGTSFAAGTGMGVGSEAAKESAKSKSSKSSRSAAGVTAAPYVPRPGLEGVTPYALPGYSGPFSKYTQEKILEIVRKMDDIVRPESMDPVKYPNAVAAGPNTELVRKQRTASMDQALRQGRPRFDSVGSVNSMDYASMLYGEGHNPRRGSNASSVGSRSKATAGFDSYISGATPAAPAEAIAASLSPAKPSGSGEAAPVAGATDGSKATGEAAPGADDSTLKGGYAQALLKAQQDRATASAGAPQPASAPTPPTAISSGRAAGARKGASKSKRGQPKPTADTAGKSASKRASVGHASTSGSSSTGGESPSRKPRGWERPEVTAADKVIMEKKAAEAAAAAAAAAAEGGSKEAVEAPAPSEAPKDTPKKTKGRGKGRRQGRGASSGGDAASGEGAPASGGSTDGSAPNSGWGKKDGKASFAEILKKAGTPPPTTESVKSTSPASAGEVRTWRKGPSTPPPAPQGEFRDFGAVAPSPSERRRRDRSRRD